MTTSSFHSIVSQINQKAKMHAIGDLARIRKDLKGKERLPLDLFPKSTTFDKYAFHFGGRKELQFNIGIDSGMDDELRYGVAFSLETNQSLPNIDVLIPKIRLFNDFIQLYSGEYADMCMWHWKDDVRSTDYMLMPISTDLVSEGVFIFLGKRMKLNRIDYETLLNDLDRLLHLYTYVESNGNQQPVSGGLEPFRFHAGFTPKASTAAVTQVQRDLDISLRHNALQEALYGRLAEKHGAQNVAGELQSGAGTSIDMVVQHGDDLWFYEIKTSDSPRGCLRQAIGQLLEYAFWPGTQEANRLIVVGERALDNEGQAYLNILQRRFGLPFEYEQITI
ncbi:MAG: PDDEXK family nuclease [Dehalococcoidia bacterium]